MMCDSCETTAGNANVRPVSLSRLPFVVSMCYECRNAGAIPYDLLLTLVWLGEVKGNEQWVLAIVHYHGKTTSEFEFDVMTFMDKMNETLED